MSTQIQQFQPGRIYYCRSSCDHDTVFRYTVLSRTARQITIRDDCGSVSRRGVKVDRGAEVCYPEGHYSMAPVIRADRCLDPATPLPGPNGLYPIGTKVVALDGFTIRVGQVADHTSDQWGRWHVVVMDGAFEKVGSIRDRDALGIGWRVAKADELSRHGQTEGPCYSGD
jgi:hypothetical protein